MGVSTYRAVKEEKKQYMPWLGHSDIYFWQQEYFGQEREKKHSFTLRYMQGSTEPTSGELPCDDVLYNS